MVNLFYPWIYTYTGQTGSWTDVIWAVSFQSQDLTCENIQAALQELKAPAAYPVDCSFTALSNTWVVFFMNPDTQQLVESVEVSTWINSDVGFSKEDVDFLYSVETGFLVVIMLTITLIRQFRKISPLLFG